MPNKKDQMIELISEYVTKSDIYAARAIAKISAFIHKYRIEAKMSQSDFARMMGVSQAMVSKWESAEYNFSIENIAQISEKLKVSFDIEFKNESEYLVISEKNDYFSKKKHNNLKEYLTDDALYNAAFAA